MLLPDYKEVSASKGQQLLSVTGGSDLSAPDSISAARPHALFNVLGPLEVRIEAASFEPAGKPAMLLGLLLLHANSWVSADQIVEALWGDVAPTSANRNIKTYVWQLRRWLPPVNDAPRVEGRRGGYRIHVEADELDASILEELAHDECRDADVEQLAQRLASALQLWRGNPYPELPPDITRIVVARQEQVRWELRERLVGALLGCGRYADAIAWLQPLVAEDPLREGLWVRLISALNGAGRRSEALGAYQRARRLLLDELGVEPGPQLREAQHQVLSGELPEAADRLTITNPPQLARPINLPRATPDFVGRGDEVRSLLSTAHAGGHTPQVATIDGMPGVGKTALALHVAHQLAANYPDGRVFCNLRGHYPQSAPAAPAEVLASLLRAFGIRDGAIPVDLEERSALWRSTLTDRRVLIVLDDAAGPAQVRPLLPGTGDCLVLVTSRRHLTEPDGAQTLTLEPLAERNALDLLAVAVGDRRVRAEEAAAVETVRLCGNLPLAIRLAASRLRQHRAWSVATLAQRLQRADSRLAELRTEDRDLSASFAASYGQLSAAEQCAFRLLGVAQNQEFDVKAVATLVQVSVADAERIMDRLLGEHLATQRGRTQYGMHDLLRAYAQQLVLDADRYAEHQLSTRLCLRGRAPAIARTA